MKLIFKLMSAAVLLSSQSHAGVISVNYDAYIVEGGTGNISGSFLLETPNLQEMDYFTGPTEAGHQAVNDFSMMNNPISSYTTNIEGAGSVSGNASSSYGYGFNASSSGVMADGSEIFEMGFGHDLSNGEDISFWVTLALPEPMYDFDIDSNPDMVGQAILDSSFLHGNAFYQSRDGELDYIAEFTNISFSATPEVASIATQSNRITSVPDPESLFLFATGLIALYFTRRRSS